MSSILYKFKIHYQWLIGSVKKRALNVGQILVWVTYPTIYWSVWVSVQNNLVGILHFPCYQTHILKLENGFSGRIHGITYSRASQVGLDGYHKSIKQNIMLCMLEIQIIQKERRIIIPRRHQIRRKKTKGHKRSPQSLRILHRKKRRKASSHTVLGTFILRVPIWRIPLIWWLNFLRREILIL